MSCGRNMQKYVHIDKIWNESGRFNSKKPPGSTLWDFIINSDSNFQKKYLKKFEKGPESIFLSLTSRCTSKCNFCHINKIHEEANLFDMLKKITALKVKYVIINGGEPFLKENLIQIIEFLSKKIRVSITTSSKIDLKILKKLLDLNISKLQFPLDGISTHNKIHENKSFDDIVQTIKNCNKVGIYTSVVTCVNKETANEVPCIIRLCEKLHVGQFSFFRFPICGIVNNNYKKMFISANEYKKINKYIFEERGKYTTHITSNDAMWKGCGAALTSCTILCNGDVYPCAFIPKKGGNIIKNDMKEIWNSRIFKKLRNRNNLKGKCGRCKYKFFCGGCRGVSYYKFNDLFASDFGCWIKG
jgi:radical SAM protein with 4Fe4S-binding SPASM domain